MQIRPTQSDDLPAIHAIYAHHVENGLGTFETEPPDVAEIVARQAAIVRAGFPYLTAQADGRVVGYAYANQFRPRTGYRGTVEDSVYVTPDAMGLGIGRALLTALIERCTALGLRQMLAFIGDSHNAASIGAHRACGFAYVGLLNSVGRKFDRWVDVVIMQRPLGAGDSTPIA